MPNRLTYRLFSLLSQKHEPELFSVDWEHLPANSFKNIVFADF